MLIMADVVVVPNVLLEELDVVVAVSGVISFDVDEDEAAVLELELCGLEVDDADV